MDIVTIDWTIWLTMIHLTTYQMGHLVKLNKKNDILCQGGMFNLWPNFNCGLGLGPLDSGF
jgi:hypothetical protein